MPFKPDTYPSVAPYLVVDGAQATRFNVYLAQLLADFRRVLL